jgi:molybdenum cofactor cytidylyltransferase
MTQTPDIAAVILAAGMSTRMGGKLKQLLPFGADEKPLIEVVVSRVVAQVDRVIVVLGHRADEISPLIGDYGVELVVNERYQQGMITSVQCGIRAAGEARGYLICLGDQPGLGERTLTLVLERAAHMRRGIAIPECDGRRGHPIYLTKHYRTEILGLPLDLGLNAVTGAHPDETERIQVPDESILIDVDTPQEYDETRYRWN